MTASPAGGEVARRMVLTAAPGEVWSFSAQIKVTALSGLNTNARLYISWRDAGGGGLGEASVTLTSTDTDFVERKIENQTAPALTASVRVELKVQSGAANGTGTTYFDTVLATKATTAGTYFDGREGQGFWQGTPDNSVSVKGANEVIAGFFKVSTGDSQGTWVAGNEARADAFNAALWQYGLAANRPAFGQLGRIYVSSDTKKVERDTGAAWELLIDYT